MRGESSIWIGPPTPRRVESSDGDSIAHWEGDTLVVDVQGLNDKTWLDMAGDFHSDQLHVMERYTPIDANTIWYEATLEDPKVYTRPWKLRLAAAPSGEELRVDGI